MTQMGPQMDPQMTQMGPQMTQMDPQRTQMGPQRTRRDLRITQIPRLICTKG
jgi:hypothetical protein